MAQHTEKIKLTDLDIDRILKPIIQKRFKPSGKLEIIVFIVVAIGCITSAGYGFEYLKTAKITSELHDVLKVSLYMSGYMSIQLIFYFMYKQYPLLHYRLHEAQDFSYSCIQGKIIKIIDEKNYKDHLQLQALIEYQTLDGTTQQHVFDCTFPTQANLYPKDRNYLVGKSVRLCLSPSSQQVLSIQVLADPTMDIFFQVDSNKKLWIFHHYGMELMEGIYPEAAITQIDLIPESNTLGFCLYFHCIGHQGFRVHPNLKNWVEFIAYLEKPFKDIQLHQLKSSVFNSDAQTQILWKNPQPLNPSQIKQNRFRFHLTALLLMILGLIGLVLVRLFLFHISFMMMLNFIFIFNLIYYLAWHHKSNHICYQIIQSRYQL